MTIIPNCKGVGADRFRKRKAHPENPIEALSSHSNLRKILCQRRWSVRDHYDIDNNHCEGIRSCSLCLNQSEISMYCTGIVLIAGGGCWGAGTEADFCEIWEMLVVRWLAVEGLVDSPGCHHL